MPSGSDRLLTATVLPDVSGLDKTFDYLVPERWQHVAHVGSLVRVPLAGRRVGGWILRIGPPGDDVPIERLVPIAKVSSVGPPTEIIALAEWAAQRWGAGRVRPLLVSASPPTMVGALPAAAHDGVRAVRLIVDHAGADIDAGAERLMLDGGGVLRTVPSADPLPIVLAAARLGPTLAVHPSVDAARTLAARLRRTGLTVALVPGEWAAAAAGVDVVIGSRAAVWAPCPDLAAVVVLDEHDEALQEERSPTWHARDVAIERARRAYASCLLVSPAPTVTALAWSGKRWMRPSFEVERAGWPIVEVVDRTAEEPWKRSPVTSALIAHLRDRDQRVVCVHNTPGRSRLLACRSCRSLLRCERCEAAVAQRDNGVLGCSQCHLERPPVCQACGSGALANVRPGVSRLREELEAAAGRPVVAVTGDSGPIPDDVNVFVGTEAVLHRVDQAHVVAFLDIDAELVAPRYRAAEQAMGLMVRAARLVGPRDAGGRILVQTFLPHHEVIQAALLADPSRVAKAEAARRRDLGLPPFGALARVSGAGAAEYVAATGLAAATGADGAFLVRAATWDELGAALTAAPRPKASRIRLEVDPPRH